MESITRNVAEIDANERQVYETVLGHALGENQQIVILVREAEPSKSNGNGNGQRDAPGQLPVWCRVFADLSDVEFSQLKDVFGRSELSRPY
jgi:hypothetical protein